MMKFTYFLLLSSIFMVSSCHKNPVTGRKSLQIMPESVMLSMAGQQYASFLTTNTVVKGTKDEQMVERVGRRIADAVNSYLSQKNEQSILNGYQWEFHLVQENTANAWCMPGGKVVVYTGILPITQNENGLAVVMGHEIAHAIARHGNERMSQTLLAQGIQVAGNISLSQNPAAVQIFNQLYGIGGNVGLMAFSRQQESEADKMGLIFMAMAGYNPNEAVPFWQRMDAMSGGQQVPEFLSTHPSNSRRISDIQKLLPTAMLYYTPNVN